MNGGSTDHHPTGCEIAPNRDPTRNWMCADDYLYLSTFSLGSWLDAKHDPVNFNFLQRDQWTRGLQGWGQSWERFYNNAFSGPQRLAERRLRAAWAARAESPRCISKDGLPFATGPSLGRVATRDCTLRESPAMVWRDSHTIGLSAGPRESLRD